MRVLRTLETRPAALGAFEGAGHAQLAGTPARELSGAETRERAGRARGAQRVLGTAHTGLVRGRPREHGEIMRRARLADALALEGAGGACRALGLEQGVAGEARARLRGPLGRT